MKLRRIVAVAALLGAVLILVACGGNAPPPTQGAQSMALVQRDGGEGGVTAEAIWVTAEHLKEMENNVTLPNDLSGYVLVHLALDTHTVDLNGYDLLGLATLQGREAMAMAPVRWIGIQESSHHRDGLLAFPGESNEAWASQEGMAELTLRQIAQVSERSLRWEFPTTKEEGNG